MTKSQGSKSETTPAQAGHALAFRISGFGFRISAPRRGFTLIELLVGIAILAVLAALALGGIGAARDQRDTASCLSNLRQLAAANIAHTSDHDGRYVTAQEPANKTRWHGVRAKVSEKFDPTRGPLAPYLGRDGRIKLCPALERVLTGEETFEDGTGGYGYNAIYIGATPADRWQGELLSNVPRPAQTVMFTDCAYARENGLQEYAYSEPWKWADRSGRLRGSLHPTVHFRHTGRANVAWCDGHVSSEIATRFGEKNIHGGDSARWQLGWFGPEDQNGYWNPQRVPAK